MNDIVPDKDRLLEEAIDLLVRMQDDPDNGVSADLIQAWRARSPLHEDIWMRVYKVHGASGHVLDYKRRIERRERLDPTRRSLMIGGLAALGGGALAYGVGSDAFLGLQADHMTRTAQISRFPLPDGSVATLGPQSAIELDYRADHRRLNLLAGMGYFDVVGDAARPFSVSSGSVTATALEASFDMSNDAGFVSISVDNGTVNTFSDHASQSVSGEMKPGDWITYDPSSLTTDRGKREEGQIASWRSNIIVSEREAISALVARIGRWVPGSVVLADASIGSRRISGIFDLSDPVRALKAAVRPAGGNVYQISSYMTVVTSI